MTQRYCFVLSRPVGASLEAFSQALLGPTAKALERFRPLSLSIDVALPPDYKSKPSRALIVLATTFVALLFSSLWVLIRRYAALSRAAEPGQAEAWQAMRDAWRTRKGPAR